MKKPAFGRGGLHYGGLLYCLMYLVILADQINQFRTIF
jgi:hypothetical protein